MTFPRKKSNPCRPFAIAPAGVSVQPCLKTEIGWVPKVKSNKKVVQERVQSIAVHR